MQILSCYVTSKSDNIFVTGAPQAPAGVPMHRRGHSTGSMHHRQLSAGSAVELGRAFDSLLSAAPTKGTADSLAKYGLFELGTMWYNAIHACLSASICVAMLGVMQSL